MLYILIYVQDGGWEITEQYREIANGNAVYQSIVKPLLSKADRVYRVYGDDTCDILKGKEAVA